MIVTTAATERLLDEVRLLWNAMARAGERLHRNEPVTIGMRAVLEFIALHGPATVPQIARNRGVARQHIQTLVNSLLSLELVALQENPAHKRSQLVALTGEGRRIIDRIKSREQRFIENLSLGLARRDLDRAASVLSKVRTAMGARR